MGRVRQRNTASRVRPDGGFGTSIRKRRERDTPVKLGGANRGNLRLFLKNKNLGTRPARSRLSPINESPMAGGRSGLPSNRCCMETVPEVIQTETTSDSSPESSSSLEAEPPDSVPLSPLDESDEEESSSSSVSMESTSSQSSLPSPEIFRRDEAYEEPIVFPTEDEPADLIQIKNSTLLDWSHAENFSMQKMPNLSSIIDFSHMHDEKDRDGRCLSGVEPMRLNESSTSEKIFADKLPNAYSPFERTPVSIGKAIMPVVPKKTPKLTRRRPIHCRKKVMFTNSAIASEADENMVQHRHFPVQKSSLTDQMTCDRVETTNSTNKSSGHHIPEDNTAINNPVCTVILEKEIPAQRHETVRRDASFLKVNPKKPRDNLPDDAKFFVFANQGERDEFFQKCWDRHSKAQSIFFHSQLKC